jgi:hypothetical protein
MTILPTGAIAGQTSRVVQSRSKFRFAVPEQAGAAAEAAALPPVFTESLLFLQEIEPPEERDAKSRRHGTDVLDLLAGLQRSLLEGGNSEGAVLSLAKLANNPPVAASPALQAAIEAISVRAQVELARSEMREKAIRA